jgi:hypothetical protein
MSRLLEFGYGDGRRMLGVAADGARVLAFDPDAEAVEPGIRSLSGDLADRVPNQVASGNEIEMPPHSFDLVVFSWS